MANQFEVVERGYGWGAMRCPSCYLAETGHSLRMHRFRRTFFQSSHSFKSKCWLIAPKFRIAAATQRPHPKWGGERVYVSEPDIEAFHARFLTTATLMTEFGEKRQTLLMKLRAANVMPFQPNGEDHGAIYLRREVEACLR